MAVPGVHGPGVEKVPKVRYGDGSRCRERVASRFDLWISPMQNSIERPLPDRLLTVKETAEFLSLGITKTYELMNRGELPYVRIDGVRRIDPSTLRAFIEAHTIGRAA
jgi:excisionase family DNA binding protein